ncbi:Concanavalin A-like lectin/glucanases superfamily [Candidatus Nanopelagicaceae bacterium]
MAYRYAYHDDPIEEIEPREPKLKRALFFVAVAAILGTAGSTLAANISLNNSGATEFGQGLLATTACSGTNNLSIKPTNIFDGTSYLVKSVTVSNIPTSCAGNDFIMNAYGTPTAPNGSIGFTNVGLSSPYLLGTVAAPGTTSTTYEWWFYSTSATPATQGMLQTRTNAAGADGMDVSLEGGGITISVGSSFMLRTTGTYLQNKWNHIAVVRNGTTVWTVYLNGTSIGSPFNFSGSTGTSLALGAKSFTGYNEFFNGYISDFRYVIGTAVYTSNFTPPTSMLPKIAGTQLLLETPSGASFLSDSSGNGIVFTKISGTPTSVSQSPFPLVTSVLPIFNSSSTTATIYDNGGSFYSGANSTGSTVTTISSSPTGSFTVSFDSPTAISSNISNFTLQSAPHS